MRDATAMVRIAAVLICTGMPVAGRGFVPMAAGIGSQCSPMGSETADADPVAPADRTISLKEGDHIIFFGDSLTAMSIGRTGWVTLVREELTRRHPGKHLLINAVATGGHTTENLLARLSGDVLSNKPTIVVIQVGVNDAARGMTVEAFKANLKSLIDQLRSAGVQIVLCSCTSLGEKRDGTNRIDAKLDEFAAVAREVAAEQNIPLNDLRKAFVDHWKQHNPDNLEKGILNYDGNHFNDDGHRFVARQMLAKFQ